MKKKRIDNAILKGTVQGMRFFQGMIERTQMSGRPGLKTQTANLKRSGNVSWRDAGLDLVVKLGWYAKYAMTHQKGMTITPKNKPYLHFKSGANWVKTKSVTIPKRLHVFEEYKNQGKKMIFDNVEEQIRVAAK